MSLPPVHLTILQPLGYVHSLGFLDQARYFRWQFRRLGTEVTISKNRLRADALNFVFGAHLGLDPGWARRYNCILENLEQLGEGGALVRPDYLKLLRHSAVVDYDLANVAAYAQDPAEVPLVRFLFAPYLDDEQVLPLEERPIDLLFFGSLNPRRRAWLDRVEASGLQVTRFDQPVYGAERDHFVRQSKAVLNCHFYDSSRFEQARAFQCLSLGTPVVSERRPATHAPAAFEDAIFWVDDADVPGFFGDRFGQPAFYQAARERLDRFRACDPLEDYADLLAFGVGYVRASTQTRSTAPWQPERINLGSGKDYKPGWLNIDVLDRAEPDLVLDLGQPITLPIETTGARGHRIRLEPGSVRHVYANNVLEHVPDLPRLMGNLLALLQDGGELQIEVPYEHAPTAWQDPTHLRALNENSWRYYTDWFWYLGWFEHRFELAQFAWLDATLKPCDKAAAAFMAVSLRKRATTLHERTTARVMRPDFGGLDPDWPATPEPPARRGTLPDGQASLETERAEPC